MRSSIDMRWNSVARRLEEGQSEELPQHSYISYCLCPCCLEASNARKKEFETGGVLCGHIPLLLADQCMGTQSSLATISSIIYNEKRQEVMPCGKHRNEF
jgi:hypothetical protein